MGWFSKKETQIDKIKNNFLDQFPTWAFLNSQRLVSEVSDLDLDKKMKGVLLDCFAGAHFVYLLTSLPPELKMVIGFDANAQKAISTWPLRAKNFAIFTCEVWNKGALNSMVTSLDALYAEGSEKKHEPISIYASICAVNYLESETTYRDPQAPVRTIPILYPVFFEVGQSTLTWLSDSVIVRNN